MGNCKPIQNSQRNSFPEVTHGDHLGNHPQIEKLQKEVFAHWFLNREKTHKDVYNEIHNYLNQKHLRSFFNSRLGRVQPILKTYVLNVNNTPQVGLSEKIQPQKPPPAAHHITSLDYPILTRRTTTLNMFAYKSIRQKTMESTDKLLMYTYTNKIYSISYLSIY